VAAGFTQFAITWRADVFSGAPQSSSAASFGTLGINFRARKAHGEDEWAATLAALNCAVPSAAPISTVSAFGADVFYDAGSQGCADGPLDEIAGLVRRLAPGQTLEVRAVDSSVAHDLPAWCRLTGHALVEAVGDHYLIRRKP
jgi:TusA-related sulfurtransferase